jgi:hypothetical protein
MKKHSSTFAARQMRPIGTKVERVLVPRDPKREVLEAGAPYCFQPDIGSWEKAIEDARECWLAMLSAASQREVL